MLELRDHVGRERPDGFGRKGDVVGVAASQRNRASKRCRREQSAYNTTVHDIPHYPRSPDRSPSKSLTRRCGLTKANETELDHQHGRSERAVKQRKYLDYIVNSPGARTVSVAQKSRSTINRVRARCR